MKNGEYINRTELRARLARACHQSRNARYRHGIEVAAGIAYSMEGVYLQDGNPFEINEATWRDGFNNVAKVGIEMLIEKTEDLINDEPVYFFELRNRLTNRAWRMYLSEENEWIGGVYDAWELIVNAPPVEPQKIVIIPHELIEKLASCVVDMVGNIDWDKAIEAYKARRQSEWIPVGERLPEGKIEPTTNDFELVLCSTVWGIVRPYKFGKPIGHDKAHFWSGAGVMDDYVIAWMPLPETYKEAENEFSSGLSM